MGKEKPGIPKGTRDFNPTDVARREYIFSTIRGVFQLHGYMPIETPSMENLSTLMGKYGEEGDRLIFRILNSGDFTAKTSDDDWQSKDAMKLAAQISEKALRYDLTVPFARYVVQYQHQITFPFKRYQMQTVWRADRPQKGRYREFFQCDADVIGSDSLMNEAGFLQIIDQVFSKLNIRVIIKVNNRKILAGLAAYLGHEDQLTDITMAIDKLDKIGLENVNKELLGRGLSAGAIGKLEPVLLLKGDTNEKLQTLAGLLSGSDTGRKGIEEIRELFDIIALTPLRCGLELDLTLARGLNYYTGAIIEVKAVDVPMGSICGGGRYDDLTGIFGLPGVSGVGVSFGADRIYDVLAELDGFPETTGTFSHLMAVHFGPDETRYCLPLLDQLRSEGVRCELYPDPAKVKKQMQYADKNHIPYVLVAGEREIREGVFSLKNMRTGEQRDVKPGEIAGIIHETL
ncbi:MAG: histidine--tRNA ligase [Bacteroidales bacterium]